MACTCVMTPEEAAKDPKDSVHLVFRGKVSTVEKLPEHPRIRGRQRYAVTLAAESYVKGGRGSKITLHELQDGTDCMGMNYVKGRRYLVFALEENASDVILDGEYCWYVRTAPCTPVRELSRK